MSISSHVPSMSYAPSLRLELKFIWLIGQIQNNKPTRIFEQSMRLYHDSNCFLVYSKLKLVYDKDLLLKFSPCSRLENVSLQFFWIKFWWKLTLIFLPLIPLSSAENTFHSNWKGSRRWVSFPSFSIHSLGNKKHSGRWVSRQKVSPRVGNDSDPGAAKT